MTRRRRLGDARAQASYALATIKKLNAEQPDAALRNAIDALDTALRLIRAAETEAVA